MPVYNSVDCTHDSVVCTDLTNTVMMMMMMMMMMMLMKSLLKISPTSIRES